MIRVNSIGVVKKSPAFVTHFGGKSYLIPVGFESERAVYPDADEAGDKKKGGPTTSVTLAYEAGSSAKDSHVCDGLYFTATVLEHIEGAATTPLFVVTRSDDPVGKRYANDKSATTAWREAFEGAIADFPGTEEKMRIPRDAKGRMQINGLRLYGILLAEVHKAVKTLSGAQEALDAFPPPPSRKDEGDAVVVVESTPPVKAKASRSSATAAAAAAAPCPDCGLVNTPFCAATGKPHALTACAQCGLTSAFCPVTGEMHPAAQRPNRQRGEVRLPKAPRGAAASKRPRTASAAAASSDDIAEITVVTTQEETGKKPRQKRTKKAKEEPATTSTATTAAGADASKKKAAPAKRQTKLEVVDKDDLPLTELPREEVYVYPALRPPLSHAEQTKAASLMAAEWKALPDQTLLSPAAAELSLPLVPRKKPVKRTRKGNEEDADKADGDGAEESGSPCGSPTLTLVHPLEIAGVSSSPAGKRFTKYRTQYTSERAKADKIKAAATASTKAGAKAADEKKAPTAGEEAEPTGAASEAVPVTTTEE